MPTSHGDPVTMESVIDFIVLPKHIHIYNSWLENVVSLSSGIGIGLFVEAGNSIVNVSSPAEMKSSVL